MSANPIASFTPTLCSPAVAKLLAKLQDAMLKETLSRGVLPKGATVLPGLIHPRAIHYERTNETVFEIRCSESTGHDTFTRYWRRPTWWGKWQPWHPAYWELQRNRRSTTGENWGGCGVYVMDDFGYLVPVGGAA